MTGTKITSAKTQDLDDELNQPRDSIFSKYLSAKKPACQYWDLVVTRSTSNTSNKLISVMMLSLVNI
ncbi:MAG: hypothetical protein ACI8XG_001582 [Congregibacter sp.]